MCSIIKKLFLLTRLYSYGATMSSTLLSLALVKCFAPLLIIQAWVLGLLMWAGLNFASERLQQNPGREIPPIWILCVTLAPGLIVAISSSSLLTLVYLAYLCSVFLYPLKAMFKPFGAFGPLLRGFNAFFQSLYFLILFGGNEFITSKNLLIISIIPILHIARNLLGDLRDIGKDTFEFPKKFGTPTTLILCVGVLLVAFFIGLEVLSHWQALCILFLAAYPLLTTIYYLKIGKSNAHAGFVGHKAFVLAVPITQCFICFIFGAPSWAIGVVLLVSFCLHKTYWITPGKDYSRFRLKFLMN